MHFLLAAALLAAPVAQTDPFCADIQRLSAAAPDPAAYEALRKTAFTPRLLHGCQRGGVGYFCHQSLLPPEINFATMSLKIAACLPGAVISPGKPWPGLKRAIVTGGGLVFELEESGADRAHVGRILHIEMRPEREPKPDL